MTNAATIAITVETARNMSAQDYARMMNVVRNAQAQAEGWSFWTLSPEDDAYWAEQAADGVVTAYDLMRRDALATYSDLYKETHGIRPSMGWLADADLAEIEREIAEVVRFAEDSIDDDALTFDDLDVYDAIEPTPEERRQADAEVWERHADLMQEKRNRIW